MNDPTVLNHVHQRGAIKEVQGFKENEFEETQLRKSTSKLILLKLKSTQTDLEKCMSTKVSFSHRNYTW